MSNFLFQTVNTVLNLSHAQLILHYAIVASTRSPRFNTSKDCFVVYRDLDIFYRVMETYRKSGLTVQQDQREKIKTVLIVIDFGLKRYNFTCL